MIAVDLIAFEAAVAARYNAGEIRAPVHLSAGNEAQLIAYFQNHFRPGDWVFSTWRSHYHALLAGVPPDEVFAAIMAGKSITLCFPEHRFFSSAIVGGHAPWALGVAMGIKRDGPNGGHSIMTEGIKRNLGYLPHVHCFIGDMAARSGIFHECREYAVGHDLPISFVCENNGKSVLTDTAEVWGRDRKIEDVIFQGAETDHIGSGLYHAPALKTFAYSYILPWPHAGAGRRIEF